jgi:hypothetical protein
VALASFGLDSLIEIFASVIVAMLLLAYGNEVTGKQLGNVVLTTEGHVTPIGAYLAGAVIIGPTPNALFSLWWAEYVAALVFLCWLISETREALEEARGEKEDER